MIFCISQLWGMEKDDADPYPDEIVNVFRLLQIQVYKSFDNDIQKLLKTYFDNGGKFVDPVHFIDEDLTINRAQNYIYNFVQLADTDAIFANKVLVQKENSWMLHFSSMLGKQFQTLQEKGIAVRILSQMEKDKNDQLIQKNNFIISFKGKEFYFTQNEAEFKALDFNYIHAWDWQHFGYSSLAALLKARVKDLSSYAK